MKVVAYLAVVLSSLLVIVWPVGCVQTFSHIC
jgi:hypothetical protein